MGQLVFQATLGGQVNLVGPNTASTYNINVPAVAGNMVTTGDTGTVTNTMLASSAYTAPGTIGSGTPNTGAFTTLSGSTSVTTPILKSSSSLTLQTNGTTTALTIDTSQNVGIGTSSPGNKLVTVSNSTNSKIEIQNTSTAASTSKTSGLQFTGTDTVGTLKESGDIYVTPADNNYVGSNMLFYTRISDTVAERMRIDSSGNVGIGTSSPATKFQVSGTSGSLNARINAGNTGLDVTNNDATGVVNLATSPLSVGSKVMSFTTYNGSSSAEAMRIDSSGNLLVGTTSVGGRLTLNYPGLTSVGAGFVDTSTTGTTQAVTFSKNSSQVGSITTSNTLTAYNVTSDYRLKKNIVPLTGALDKIARIKPSVYNYKSDSKTQIEGFIAHELQEIVPHAVTGEKDAVDAKGNPIYQGVDASFLIPHLIAAIQELNAKFEEYKAAHP